MPEAMTSLFGRDAEFGNRLVKGGEDAEIATSGTPNGFDIALVIGCFEVDCFKMKRNRLRFN